MNELTDYLRSMSEVEGDTFDQAANEIERLRGDLEVAQLQRDARVVSEFVIDAAVQRELERLRAALENTYCEYCGCGRCLDAEEAREALGNDEK